MYYNFKFNIYWPFVKDILYKIQISDTNFPANRVALSTTSGLQIIRVLRLQATYGIRSLKPEDRDQALRARLSLLSEIGTEDGRRKFRRHRFSESCHAVTWHDKKPLRY